MSRKTNRQQIEPNKWEVAKPGMRAIYQAIGGSWAKWSQGTTTTPNLPFCQSQRTDSAGIQKLIDRYAVGERWITQAEFVEIINTEPQSIFT